MRARAAGGHRALLAFLVLALAPSLPAHVGSPDTFFQGTAGPYRLRVTVRPPGVVPGRAEIFVRVEDPGVSRVTVRPRRYDAGPRGAPPADEALIVPGDPGLRAASLWLMSGGEHAVEIEVSGSAGPGRAVVPVASVATRTLPMGGSLLAIILSFAALLVAGGLAIVFAAANESTLPPGEAPSPARRRTALAATGIAAAIFLFLLAGENVWSQRVHDASRRGLFRPYAASAAAVAGPRGRILRLTIDDPAWRGSGWHPLVPDHGKLVHLFAMREPGLDAFAHLHPLPVSDRAFEASLPDLPAGTYSVFADMTDETGFSQTVVARAEVPRGAGRNGPSDPDDSWRSSKPVPPVLVAPPPSDLGDGLTMTWEGSGAPIVARREASLVFSVRDAAGRPAPLEPYMGMGAHAAVVRDDGSVFVHLHPMGTSSMASLEIARGGAPASGGMEGMTHDWILDGRVAFPYEFPKPGPYRLWVQVKLAGRVRTGVFDALIR